MKKFLLVLMASLGILACSDDTGGNNANCGVNQELNPITGECINTNIRPERDAGGNTDASDVPPNPFLDMPADVPDNLLCDPDIDSDLDGLTNKCECDLTTDPARPDTDNDGALDGDEDSNQNCKWDLGLESNPRVDDTDLDGALDGAERRAGTDPLDPDSDDDNVTDGAELASGCLNPLESDTDGDGLPDDVEDVNLDGNLGSCPNRVYAVDCAEGESDPCKKDTDGDGTEDSSEAQFLACTPADTAGLAMPQYVSDQTGDYKLVVDSGVTSGALTGLNGHAINDAANGYAGFVINLDTPNNVTDPSGFSGRIFLQARRAYAGAVQRSNGRRIQTFDGFSASVRGVVELGGSLKADTARDKVLAEIAGIATVTHNTAGSFSTTGASDKMLFIYEVVIRNGGKSVIVGAVVPESEYSNDTKLAGIRVDDLTGGVAVAKFIENVEPECVSYKVTVEPKIDFIWVIDTSGSMDDEIAQVRGFARQFATILQNSNLDWRIAVTAATCDKIKEDPAISQEVKNLFGDSCDPPPIPFPIPIGEPKYKNGELCDRNNAYFTNDPAKFEDCVGNLSNGGPELVSEHTVTIGTAAIDRALPRAENNPQKIRPGAAVVVISVTDEFDDYFQQKNGWRDAGGSGDAPSDPTIVGGYDPNRTLQYSQPFIDYYLRPEVGATVFGIYWIPGTGCGTASEAAAGIESVVSATGGTAGSICQPDLSATLQQIADASAGLASGLRLRGVPLAPTMAPKIGEAATGNIVAIPRSRADGYDYDSVVNRVSFTGPNPPQTADRIILPYLRWETLTECTMDSDCPQEQKMRCIDGTCL